MQDYKNKTTDTNVIGVTNFLLLQKQEPEGWASELQMKAEPPVFYIICKFGYIHFHLTQFKATWMNKALCT